MNYDVIMKFCGKGIVFEFDTPHDYSNKIVSYDSPFPNNETQQHIINANKLLWIFTKH